MLRTVIIAWLISLLTLQALAAEPSQGDLLLQQEQQRQQQLQREIDQAKPGRAVILPSQPATASEPPSSNGPCFSIQQIQVEGAKAVPASVITSLYQPFLGQCLNVSALNQLVGKITSHYVDAGFLTSRAYIPQQNLATGTLRILIVEGLVETVEIQGDNRKRLATAFPHLIGKPLNLRNIEQGIDVLSQSGAEAKVDFVPGEHIGGTRVIIRVKPRKAHFISAGFDNNGQASTGKNRMSFTGAWDNPAGINDNLWLNMQTTAPSQSHDNRAQSLAVTYAIPFGAWQLAIAHQGFNYRSIIPTEKPQLSDGNSKLWSLEAKYLMLRDQNSLLHLGGKLKSHDIENRIEGERIGVSSRRYSAAELFLSHQQLWSFHQLNNRISVWQGLNSNQAELSANTPDTDFTKFTLDTNWQSRWQWAGRSITWRSDLFAQYSDANLYSSETLNIGGKYSVRGFESASSQGNTGAWWRNSISTLLRGHIDSAGFWQPYIALDTGEVEHGPIQIGAALGTHYSGQNLQLQLEISKSLVTEELPSEAIQKDINLNLSWRW